MQLPLQLTFHGISPSPAITDYVQRRAKKLDLLYGRIVTCRVAIEEPHRHSREGRRFRVRVDVSVPGQEIVISKDLGASELDAYAAIDAAFDEAKRRLHDHAAIRRGDVKSHERAAHGWVTKLFNYEGYGFITNERGEEIYFHRNSVLHHAFDRVKLGSRVRYLEEDGDDGTHATSVALLRHGHLTSAE